MNPYEPPDSFASVPDAKTGPAISRLRSAVNIGCGVGGILFTSAMWFLSLLDGFAGITLGDVLVYGLLTLGFGHSVFWAMRRPKADPSPPDVLALDLKKAHDEHRRMYGY